MNRPDHAPEPLFAYAANDRAGSLTLDGMCALAGSRGAVVVEPGEPLSVIFDRNELEPAYVGSEL